VAHRHAPSGSGFSCFAPLASPIPLGVRQRHEGGAITSAPLRWELDVCPHPHAQQVLKGSHCTFGSHPLGSLQVSGERITAPSEPDGILSHHPALQFPHSFVQDRFGSSHHAYLCVLSVGKPASLRRWASFSPLCPCRRLSRPRTSTEAPLPWGSRPVGNPTLYPCCTYEDGLGVPFVPL